LLPSARSRIIFSFALLTAVFVVVVSTAAYLAWDHDRQLNRAEIDAETVVHLRAARAAGADEYSSVQGYILTGNESTLTQASASQAKIIEELTATQQLIDQDPGDVRSNQYMQDLIQGAAPLASVLDEVVTLRRSGDVQGATGRLFESTPSLLGLSATYDAFEAAEHQQEVSLRASADRTSALTTTFLIVSGLVGLVIGTMGAAIVTRSLFRSFRRLEDASRAIVGGDLLARAPESGATEFATLGAAFNQMTAALKTTIDLLEQRVEERTARLSRANKDLGAEIAERKRAEERLRLLTRTVEQSPSLIVITDPDGNIEYINPKFSEVTGYLLDEVKGKNPRVLQSGETAVDQYSDLWRTIKAGRVWKGELLNRKKNGGFYWASEVIAPVTDEQGGITNFVAVQENVTERRAAEDSLHHAANYDSLTGLANRRLLLDRLDLALAQAHREARTLAVAFLDLDHFKVVNDTMGHAAGDLLLQRAAERLTSLMREGDTVARMGGDEFTVLLPAIARVEDTVEVTERILEHFREPWVLFGQKVRVTASIGIALYPNDGEDAETLLANADMAMYRAKELGRDKFQLYTPDLNATIMERAVLERDLRDALERQQFVIHYQPQVDISSGRIQGMEALVRWEHPDRGLLPPKEFIARAEETGLIVPIGEWILRTACAQNKAWQEAGLPTLRLAVNLSAVQFNSPRLIELVRNVLNETGLAHESLQLEITESTAMFDVERTAELLGDLRQMGIDVALDDFGTGHSSLSYLAQFPITTLKIDQSFVARLPADENAVAITMAIMTLARSLNLTVVAEGVETDEQLAWLKNQGCEEFQGYLFSKPLPAEAFEALIRHVNDFLEVARH